MRWLIGCCVVAFLALSVDALMRIKFLTEELPGPSQLRTVQVVVHTVESGRRCSLPGKRQTCWQELKLVAEDGQWWWLARLPETLTHTSVAAFVQPGERVEVGVYASTAYTLRRLQPAPARLGLGESREVFSDAQLRTTYAAWASQQRVHLGLAVLAMLFLALVIWRWRQHPTVASVILPTWIALFAWFVYPKFAGEPFPERAELHPQVVQFAALGVWVDCTDSQCQPQTLLLDQQQQRWPLASATTVLAGSLNALKPGTPLSLGIHQGKVYSVAVLPTADEPASNCGYRLNERSRTTEVTWQCGEPAPGRDAGFREQLRHAEAKHQQAQPVRSLPELISYDRTSDTARQLRQISRDWNMLAIWGLLTLVLGAICFSAVGRMPLLARAEAAE
jgi:hypothetical protein